MSVVGSSNILAGASGQGGGYTIEESLRFNASQSSYLSRTPASAGNRKTWTWSSWVKRGVLSSSQPIFCTGTSGSSYMAIATAGDYITLNQYTGSYNVLVTTSAVLRDPSAWYHLVFVLDTTQATSTDRVKIYINGTRQTSFVDNTFPSLNYDGLINSATASYIGQFSPAGYAYFDGYLTEVNFIDGQALDASSFGEYNADTGVWQPAEYDGTYGTNGFYLPFGFDAPATSDAVEVLVIAGGGGGGSTAGGGGGAGGFREATLSISTSSTYTVTVGAGGPSDTPGNDSVFSTVTSVAGGNGSPFLGGGNGSGGAGGSGGGAGGRGQAGVTQSGGTGTAYQGNNGGNTLTSSFGGGGGGGGAGAVGSSVTNTSTGAAGGSGKVSTITGSSVTYAGGGGGGGDNSGGKGAGGSGGGGAGGTPGNAGTANRGGGGGGGSNPGSSTGGTGGSGIVIIKYPDTRTITIGAGLTGSTATSGAFKVTTITAGTGTVSFA